MGKQSDKQQAYEVLIAAMCGALFLASMIRLFGIEI